MSYIPKNAKQILSSASLMRDYALKPFGFNMPTNCNFPKKHPQYKFFQLDVVLHRPGQSVAHEPNTLQFKIDQKLSKPEIKQYLEKLYNLKIEKVNTARFMGKVYRTNDRKMKVKPNFKKAFVMTEHKICPLISLFGSLIDYALACFRQSATLIKEENQAGQIVNFISSKV